MKNRTQSPNQMPTYESAGGELCIYWDEQVLHPEGMDGNPQTIYSYAYCTAGLMDNYESLVTKIIRSQYTIDDEFAAINDGGERHANFLAFRALAKTLARDWISQR